MLLSIFVFIFLSSSCACDDNIYLPEEVDMANIIIACINELEKRIKVLEDKLMDMKPFSAPQKQPQPNRASP